MEIILIFLLLLVFSAFFSGTETAYFNLRTHRKDLPKKLRVVLQNPRKLLAALLTGNTLVNVAIASLAAYLTAQYAEQSQWNKSTLILIEVLVVSIVVLIFGEILPKMAAIHQSEKIALWVYRPLKILTPILHPIALVFHSITDLIIKVLRINPEKIFESEEELIILAELGEEEGTLQEEESDMIQSIFEFKDKTVGEIITPRVDIVALKSNDNIDSAMDIIGEKQFSKIPVYKDSIDNIKGILFAKDIIPYLLGSRPGVNLVTLSRTPFFVPETKPIDELLLDFKARKTNIAIVVDEWGGTAGLVTLEDVVEEVMGEIRDPFDKEESPVLSQKDGSFIVDASITIYDLEEETDIEFPDEREYDTLAGFILDIVTDIPRVGEEVEFNGRVYTVKSLVGNRIGKVHISEEKS